MGAEADDVRHIGRGTDLSTGSLVSGISAASPAVCQVSPVTMWR